MSISVIDSNTKSDLRTIPLPSFVEKYQDANTASLAKVHYVLKKISFIKTSSSKGISDVSGTTRKPFKQKGTGNARSGSLRSPQYRGGGIIFGPQPVNASYKINKKEKIHAKKVLISKLIKSEKVIIINEIQVSPFNTKDAQKFIANLDLKGRVAIIHDNEVEYGSLKSFSNLHNVGVYSNESFYIYEIIKYDTVVFTEKSFKKLSEILS